MNPSRPGGGWIEVIVGPMFSGKSEELIRLLRRALIARQRVQVFKPRLDNRYAAGDVVSHSQMRIPCELVEHSDEIMPRLDPRTEVVGIDEAQFFDAELPRVCRHIADLGKRVIVAGLDLLAAVRRDHPGLPVILITAFGTVESASSCGSGRPSPGRTATTSP